ncbi:alpha/beta hydrolase family protein [Gemmobacter nectariphilus]|uniref:alpha/beta hydrolase family protein n=1 Tax=Gemmobacter nectariphilus TaxID=220343 RepID=UPI0003FC3EDD|nr:alpha/beta hydrolase [Gemmobacter nectariphilus]
MTEDEVRIMGPGGPLAGRLILPEAPDKAIVINAATAVPAGYYAPFARWLASEHSAAVLIWDYRDFAASGDPRRSRATMADWGVHDAAAVRRWMGQRCPGLPLWVIGHSLGGLALPFQPDLHLVDRAIIVAAGPVALREHPWPLRAGIAAMWHGYGPAAVALLGYFPGRRMMLGADVPGPAFRQWRRWCTTDGSCLADPDMPPLASPALSCPVTLISFSDDGMVPAPAVTRLADWMPKAAVTRRLIAPQDHGVHSIGHIAAFASRNRAVWPALVA